MTNPIFKFNPKVSYSDSVHTIGRSRLMHVRIRSISTGEWRRSPSMNLLTLTTLEILVSNKNGTRETRHDADDMDLLCLCHWVSRNFKLMFCGHGGLVVSIISTFIMKEFFAFFQGNPLITIGSPVQLRRRNTRNLIPATTLILTATTTKSRPVQQKKIREENPGLEPGRIRPVKAESESNTLLSSTWKRAGDIHTQQAASRKLDERIDNLRSLTVEYAILLLSI